SRRHASRLISQRLFTEARGAAAILTGDFNCYEDDPAYVLLVKHNEPGAIRWVDAYRQVHPWRSPQEASFNGYTPAVEGSRIDYIFHTDHFEAAQADIVRTPPRDGVYPSDHYPVTATLRWR